MIDISIVARKRIVNAIDCLLEFADRKSVSEMCHDCGLTFDEYRAVCDIAMPALRQKSDTLNVKFRFNTYKGIWRQKQRALEKRCERLLGLR